MRGVERSETALNLAELSAARKHRSMTDVPHSILLRFARGQRANAVQAEAIIWRAVRDRRCEGAKFRRQVALGNFIVDFICFDGRLVVEIDGPTHEEAEQQAKDSERDAWLGPHSRGAWRIGSKPSRCARPPLIRHASRHTFPRKGGKARASFCNRSRALHCFAWRSVFHPGELVNDAQKRTAFGGRPQGDPGQRVRVNGA